MRIACLMMQKNEHSLLPHWVKHHSRLFGAENLYIYDNGSNDLTVIHQLAEAEADGVNVDYSKNTKSDFESKGRIIAEKINQLDDSGNPYDFYFPLDCDEFVACIGDNDTPTIDAKSIQNTLAPLLEEKRVLAIGLAYDNSPVNPEYFLPRPDQRKCFFARNSCLHLDIGFHEGISKHSTEKIKTKITYFHYHHKPYSDYITSAKEKLIGRVASFSEEDLNKHLANRGPGFHLIPRLLMSKNEYEKQFNNNNRIHLPAAPLILTDPNTDKADDSEMKTTKNPENTHPTQGFVDTITITENTLTFSGWALVKNKTQPKIIKTQINNKEISVLNLNFIDRPDVATATGASNSRCGFAINIESNELLSQKKFPNFFAIDEDGNKKEITIGRGAQNTWDNFIQKIDTKIAISIPDKPSMPPECIALLEELLGKSKCYLEYGSGGSTILATRAASCPIVTVESDTEWLRSVEEKARSLSNDNARLHPIAINIGKTKEWGYPKDESQWKSYWKYPTAAWNYCSQKNLNPDLILIDGRFRRACFTASLLNATTPSTILFDDYSDRKHYHSVETFIKPTRMIGRMAIFEVTTPGQFNRNLVNYLCEALADTR